MLRNRNSASFIYALSDLSWRRQDRLWTNPTTTCVQRKCSWLERGRDIFVQDFYKNIKLLFSEANEKDKKICIFSFSPWILGLFRTFHPSQGVIRRVCISERRYDRIRFDSFSGFFFFAIPLLIDSIHRISVQKEDSHINQSVAFSIQCIGRAGYVLTYQQKWVTASTFDDISS